MGAWLALRKSARDPDADIPADAIPAAWPVSRPVHGAEARRWERLDMDAWLADHGLDTVGRYLALRELEDRDYGTVWALDTLNFNVAGLDMVLTELQDHACFIDEVPYAHNGPFARILLRPV